MNSVKPSDAALALNAKHLFDEQRLRLEAALASDRDRACQMIEAIIASVQLRLEGDQVWGVIETDAAVTLACLGICKDGCGGRI